MRSYLYNAECAKYCMWKHKKISLIIEKIELRQANNSVYLPFSCPIGALFFIALDTDALLCCPAITPILNLLESLFEVCDDVFCILKTYGEAHESFRNVRCGTLFRCVWRVSH